MVFELKINAGYSYTAWGMSVPISVFPRLLIFELGPCVCQTDGQTDGRARHVRRPNRTTDSRMISDYTDWAKNSTPVSTTSV